MTTRLRINEIASCATKMIVLMTGKEDREVDALFDPKDVACTLNVLKKLVREAEATVNDPMFQQWRDAHAS